MIKRILTPFTTPLPKHFSFWEKTLTIMYYPVFCMMWWGYYMWKRNREIGVSSQGGKSGNKQTN